MDELFCALLRVNKYANNYNTSTTQVQPQVHPKVQPSVQPQMHFLVCLCEDCYVHP